MTTIPIPAGFDRLAKGTKLNKTDRQALVNGTKVTWVNVYRTPAFVQEGETIIRRKK